MKLIETLTIHLNPNFKTLNPTTLLNQLAFVFAKSETKPTMNAYEFIKHELECDLSNSYIATKKEICNILDDVVDNKLFEGIKNMQIGDVVDM
jgi:hypothetical protein